MGLWAHLTNLTKKMTQKKVCSLPQAPKFWTVLSKISTRFHHFPKAKWPPKHEIVFSPTRPKVLRTRDLEGGVKLKDIHWLLHKWRLPTWKFVYRYQLCQRNAIIELSILFIVPRNVDLCFLLWVLKEKCVGFSLKVCQKSLSNRSEISGETLASGRCLINQPHTPLWCCRAIYRDQGIITCAITTFYNYGQRSELVL